MKTLAFKAPDDAIALLWRRSFPDEHQKLVIRARDNDPFEDARGIPEDQLTPSTFGLVGWGRGLVPEVFNQLGYPLTNGAMAALDAGGRLEVTHTIPALNALKERFPELVQIEGEQDGTEQPATRPESKSEGGDKPQPDSEGRSR